MGNNEIKSGSRDFRRVTFETAILPWTTRLFYLGKERIFFRLLGRTFECRHVLTLRINCQNIIIKISTSLQIWEMIELYYVRLYTIRYFSPNLRQKPMESSTYFRGKVCRNGVHPIPKIVFILSLSTTEFAQKFQLENLIFPLGKESKFQLVFPFNSCS